MEAILGLAIAVAVLCLLAGAALIVAAPFARFLSNDPDDVKESERATHPKQFNWLYLYTKVLPGQIKIFMRGSRVVAVVMNMQGVFLEKNRLDPSRRIDEWEWANVLPYKDHRDVVKGGEPDDLTDWGSPWLRWYRRWVYQTFGYVFVGISVWQGVRTAPFTNISLEQYETDGPFPGQKSRAYKTNEVRELTDHFRVRETSFAFLATDAEVRENLKLDVPGHLYVEVDCGLMTAFAIDRFEEAVRTLAESEVVAFLKTQPLTSVLTSTEEEKHKVAEHLKKALSDQLKGWGMRIKRVAIPDFVPKFSLKELAALTEKWVRERAKEGRFQDAEGEKKFLTETLAALGDVSPEVLSARWAQIETAKAAGAAKNANVFLGEGSGAGGGNAALMAKMDELISHFVDVVAGLKK